MTRMEEFSFLLKRNQERRSRRISWKAKLSPPFVISMATPLPEREIRSIRFVEHVNILGERKRGDARNYGGKGRF
jgi:hypothetical protein